MIQVLITRNFPVIAVIMSLVIPTPVLAATISGRITGVMGNSDYYLRTIGRIKKVTFDIDYKFDKIMKNGNYILDTTKNNIINFGLYPKRTVAGKTRYNHYVEGITITSVKFVDPKKWDIEKIEFEGFNQNDTRLYRKQPDYVTDDPTTKKPPNSNRKVDVKNGFLSGHIDFMAMTGEMQYKYTVQGVFDASDPNNLKEIKPIPPEYANGYPADTTTLIGNTIPKPTNIAHGGSPGGVPEGSSSPGTPFEGNTPGGQKIPEPSSMLGFFILGTIGTVSILKRKNQENHISKL